MAVLLILLGMALAATGFYGHRHPDVWFFRGDRDRNEDLSANELAGNKFRAIVMVMVGIILILGGLLNLFAG